MIMARTTLKYVCNFGVRRGKSMTDAKYVCHKQMDYKGDEEDIQEAPHKNIENFKHHEQNSLNRHFKSCDDDGGDD